MNEIIQALKVLVQLHQELLTLSKEKTEIIKDGKIELLQKAIVRERKLINQVEQAENTRMQLVQSWLQNENLPTEDSTITKILEQLTDEEDRTNLEQVTIDLTRMITDLKAQEKLNLALISQSMQFVQLSLDLLSPSLKNLNYTNAKKPNSEEPNRSIFDSKA